MVINYDLENSPLQIRTNTITKEGSSVRIEVLFHPENDETLAGGVTLFFGSPVYLLSQCTSNTKIPKELPTETDKVWTISLTRTSTEIRVVVICNDNEVLNIVLSDTTCSSSSWKYYWSKEVKRIKFRSNYDKASDFCRSGLH